MKKTLLAALILGAVGSASAQTLYSENFNGVTAPALPAGYVDYNVDGSTPDVALAGLNFGTHGWVSVNYTNGGRAALSYSYKTPQADDWMITPPITLTTNCGLSWTGQAFYASPNNDGYEVRISVTGVNTADFTDVVFSTPGEVAANNATPHFVDLSAYNGKTIHIAFRNNSQNKTYVAIDDIVVKQKVTDASFSTLNAGEKYATSGTKTTVAGSIYNSGDIAITSADVYYSVNGGTPSKQSLTGLNVAPFGKSSFTFIPQLNRATDGTYLIKAWVANVNGSNAADGVPSNDSTHAFYYGVSNSPAKKVTIEEGTGTWCGYCPRGAVYMDSISKTNPNDVVLIAVHNQDPMTVGAYDSGVGTLIQGYPSVLLNRNDVTDPLNIFSEFATQKTTYALADLTVSAYYDVNTYKVVGSVSAKFAAPIDEDFRLAMVITEDSVTGTSTPGTHDWDQHNYYYDGSLGAMGGFEHRPNYVTDMRYDFVARDIAGGFTGFPGSLPAHADAGSTQTFLFSSAPLTTVQHLKKLKANFLLIDSKNNRIYNANSALIANASGIAANPIQVTGVSTYPNPAVNELNVAFNLTTNETVNVIVTNALGQNVMTLPATSYPAGSQKLTINTSDLAPGAYFVQLGTNTGSVSEGFIKH